MWTRTINIFPEKGGDTSVRITILDKKKQKTDRQVMQTLVLFHLRIYTEVNCSSFKIVENGTS